ncbi:hypothetical protein OVA11_06090 [Caulobacter sp. SL161]|uniref:hypothetical protein n=1 Tax=Caulobacter sp. SL161 TaxID=2995156 RepID=UPI0022755A7A|nr:hypothetical protein [Caulobacter sp. SL161]MCY1646659.1 hypothetical protein [Caulobacter sp. SL161]
MSAGAWTLTESFTDAAARSYLAAMVLEDAGDPTTSGHLYGVAAECAVKGFLESANITIDKPLKVHFPKLTQALGLHGQGRTMLPLLGLLEGPPELLAEYSIHSRYAQDNCVDDALCSGWKADTQRILSFCGFSI